MRRESNPTLRVVRILDFLTSRPDDSFGLSELSQILGMSKATCLAVLSELVNAGYLLQDPTSRAYCLGPSSVAVGQAAATRFPALEPAGEVMDLLSTEFGLQCLVMIKSANHLVLLGHHTARKQLAPVTGRPGYRAPLIPPLGVTLMAFAPDADVAAWFARLDPPADASERARHHRVLASVRTRGFAAMRRNVGETFLEATFEHSDPDPYRQLYQLTPEATRRAREEDELYVLSDLDDESTYSVSTIAAPVFGTSSTPEFSLVLEGFRWDLTGAEIRAIGGRMVAAAHDLSRSLGGHPPVFRP